MTGLAAAPAKPSALTPNLVGAGWMLASAVCFTAMTTMIKYLGAGYSPALQTFYRQLAGVIILLPMIAPDWKRAFYATRPGVLFFRAGAGTLATILSFYAYQELPLADANALSFTRALWITPLAFFTLGEKLGAVRVGATLVGFLGVLLMLAPAGHAPLGVGQMAALASSFLFALTVTGMKLVTRDHSPFTILVWSAFLGLVFSLPPALFSWRWPHAMDLLLLGIMGVLGVGSQACYIKGMQIGDAAAMAPIDYTRLIFAIGAGLVLFHQIPGLRTLAGAGVVILATLAMTWREHHVARRESRAER
jgi:drug/metabolite transporter (DMT)-like permease